MITKLTIITEHDKGPTETITFEGAHGIAVAAAIAEGITTHGDAEFRKVMEQIRTQPRGVLRRSCINCGYVGPQA